MVGGVGHLRYLWKRPGPRRAVSYLAAVSRGEIDYKTVWNGAAHRNAHDAILTGATGENFERTARTDGDLIARFLRGGDVVLAIGCGVGRVENSLASRVKELWAVDISGEMVRLARQRLAGLENVHVRE